MNLEAIMPTQPPPLHAVQNFKNSKLLFIYFYILYPNMYYRCAFMNTPKYNEAKRQGAYRIVKSNWIDKCHSNRCRYPWRRYL